MEDQFIKKLAKAEKEIRALKTAKKIPSLIRGFSYSFEVVVDGTGDQYQNGMYHYRVTYDDGIQPVLSEFYYEGLVWPKSPNENIQDIYCYSQTTASATIMSTRPVLSVQKIVN